MNPRSRVSTQSSIKGMVVSLADCAIMLRDMLRQYIDLGRREGFSSDLQDIRRSFQEAAKRDISIDEFTDNLSQIIVCIILLKTHASRKGIEPDMMRVIKSTNTLLKNVLELLDTKSIPESIKQVVSRIENIVSGYDISMNSNDLGFAGIDFLMCMFESLLENTNKSLRRETGAYYTPIPVVRYILLSIDILLKDNFKKDNGLADDGVRVLDFAAGTGRFIIELMRHKAGCSEGRPVGDKSSNIHAFELSIMPYLILKISVSVFHYLYLESRDKVMPVIHLADTLDPNIYSNSFIIEKEIPLVVLGNPPYSNRMRDSGNWIKGMLSLYKPKTEKKLNLDDYYIKFIRLAHHLIEEAKTGIVGIITNNSFIDGITHRKMRLELLRSFDLIYVLDLHGDAKTSTSQRDENIFDIKQGVCILLMVKGNESGDREGKVYYNSIYGDRESKFSFLNRNNINTTTWQRVDYKGFDDCLHKTRWKKGINTLRLFIPKNNEHIKDYGNFWGITEVFDRYISGIQTKRDKITVHFSKEGLEGVLQDLSSLEEEDFRSKYNLPPDGRDWRYAYALRDVKELGIKEEYLCEIGYRPFDKRFTYLVDRSRGFVAYPRFDMMKYMTDANNLGIVFHRQAKRGSFSCFIADAPIDGGFLNEWSYIAPLYIGDRDNLSIGFREYLRERYKDVPKPEEILGYIYAVLNNKTFVTRYNDLLCIDFPRIPFLKGNAFRALSYLGLQLIDCHLLKINPNNEIRYYGSSTKCIGIEKIHLDNDRLYLFGNAFLYPVISRVYDYKTGNVRIIERWLKARKGIVLSQGDIEELKTIIGGISISVEVEREIERVSAEAFKHT